MKICKTNGLMSSRFSSVELILNTTHLSERNGHTAFHSTHGSNDQTAQQIEMLTDLPGHGIRPFILQ